MIESEKWQPMLIVADDRLECDCGALAIIIVLYRESDEVGEEVLRHRCWCQSCFQKMQQEEEA